MITRERHNEIVDEFIEHGILSHNIKLLHYGNLLIEAMDRLDCNLGDLLGAINRSAQVQIKNYEFGDLQIIDYEKLIEYLADKITEKHKTCLSDQFDNGYLWAMKELQILLLKKEFTKND